MARILISNNIWYLFNSNASIHEYILFRRGPQPRTFSVKTTRPNVSVLQHLLFPSSSFRHLFHRSITVTATCIFATSNQGPLRFIYSIFTVQSEQVLQKNTIYHDRSWLLLSSSSSSPGSWSRSGSPASDGSSCIAAIVHHFVVGNNKSRRRCVHSFFDGSGWIVTLKSIVIIEDVIVIEDVFIIEHAGPWNVHRDRRRDRDGRQL